MRWEIPVESYVRARYGRGYKIMKEQLEYLGQRVKILQRLMEAEIHDL